MSASPDCGWVDFDPTNGVVPSTGHITVAWARDYNDLGPVTGILIGGRRLRDFRFGHGRLDRLELVGGLGILDRLEHDVALEQFPDMGLQLEGRHLEQSDGLLQLRRHGQLLTHAQLQ